jgi:hypothetical protein
MAFNFITLPEVFTEITKWVTVLSAILIGIHGLKFLKTPTYEY